MTFYVLLKLLLITTLIHIYHMEELGVWRLLGGLGYFMLGYQLSKVDSLEEEINKLKNGKK